MSDLIYEKIKKYTNIIWDWNGTLINDTQISDQILFEQLRAHKLEVPTISKIRKMFCFPIKDFYQRVGFDLDSICFEDLSAQYHKKYKENLHKAKLFSGVRETLQKLSKAQKNQFVLSASQQDLLENSIQKFELMPFFKKTFGVQNHFGNTKKHIGEKLMNEFSLNPHKTILIGDSEHDFEVAHFMGIEALLVADGFQDYSILSKKHHNVLETRF